jgi:hypothetical protein
MQPKQQYTLSMPATECRSSVGTGQAVLHGYAGGVCSTVATDCTFLHRLEHSVSAHASHWLRFYPQGSSSSISWLSYISSSNPALSRGYIVSTFSLTFMSFGFHRCL